MNEKNVLAEIDLASLALTVRQQSNAFIQSITDRHGHLFAAIPVLITPEQLAQMQAVIAAVEAVVKMPGWNEKLYSSHTSKGVFFGYDFHLNENGAHLIEINTNAGGTFLNSLLLQSHQNISLPGKSTANKNLDQELVEMFRNEYRLECGDDAQLRCIAIVDEAPAEQYLYPEFILAQSLFEQAGIGAVIADPKELEIGTEGVYLRGQKIDLVYNRLTDFSLADYPALLQAYQQKQIVLTPNPEAYTRYANKRNLVKLTDTDFLSSLKVDSRTIDELQNGIPQTRLVKAEDADSWWTERKHWFFKPVSGYGAKGAYRGDKITKRVFDEIMAGDYVAQKVAIPGECAITLNGKIAVLKYDVRCYVYDGQIQLIAARLYQGQTTNFRTPGGGFAMVRVV